MQNTGGLKRKQMKEKEQLQGEGFFLPTVAHTSVHQSRQEKAAEASSGWWHVCSEKKEQ